MQRIAPDRPHPLFDTEATRRIETAAAAPLPLHTLMHRAGAATARLAMALAPHARTVWIACGPGNNGGDGLAAARCLHLAGRPVAVTLAAEAQRLPPDAADALARAHDAGVRFVDHAPAGMGTQDLAIDALLGLGHRPRATPVPPGLQLACAALARAASPVLALDLPSGLSADTGVFAPDSIARDTGDTCASARIRAQHTLTFLTAKPGLFTAEGRDAAGTVWLDTLGIDPGTMAPPTAPTAWLAGPPGPDHRPHASHKGRFGDVTVIGGEGVGRRGMGMEGAALLAATAALHAGAGRVLLATLGDAATAAALAWQPELMLRSPAALDMRQATTVCGCGGGEAVRALLPQVLAEAVRLVLDADALNAIAGDPALQRLLGRRAARDLPTVLTPHPLEAARLLGLDGAQRVQADRIGAAADLAGRYGCVVVLKGSGTVVAQPGRAASVNPTGNGLLATAGTGDVLAGMVGAALAVPDADPFDAAVSAVFRHGQLADRWPPGLPLTAGRLARLHA